MLPAFISYYLKNYKEYSDKNIINYLAPCEFRMFWVWKKKKKGLSECQGSYGLKEKAKTTIYYKTNEKLKKERSWT